MSGITADIAKKHLEAWLEAELTVTSGQSYTLTSTNGGRTLTRANLTEIRNSIEYWEKKLKESEAAAKGRSRSRIYRGVPRDW